MWRPNNNGEAPVSVELRTVTGNMVILQGMNVILTVEQYVAQVEVVTRFVNKEDNPIEAVYVNFSFLNLFSIWCPRDSNS